MWPPAPSQWRVHGPPAYFGMGIVAQRIAWHVPSVKLVCVLRDSVIRFHSRMTMSLLYRQSDKTCGLYFPGFWHLEKKRCKLVGARVERTGVCTKYNDARNDVVGRGMYWSNLKVWGHYFRLTGNEWTQPPPCGQKRELLKSFFLSPTN
eukprot:5496862-Amphidinium_carterae.1